MVGDDPDLDMAATGIGMRTFYVGAEGDVDSDWRGTLIDLSDRLTHLAL